MRRKVLASLCALMVLLTSVPQLPARAAEGLSGIPISTKEELLQFASDCAGLETQDAYLTADIDLSGEVFDGAVIKGTFKGTFDGKGKAITGLTISNKTEKNVGLFETISGKVQNLTIYTSGAGVTSAIESNIGILAGSATGKAEISGVSVAGTVAVNEDAKANAAGFIGYVAGEDVRFVDSTNNADVSNGYYENLAEMGVNYFGNDKGYEKAFDGDVTTAFIPGDAKAKRHDNWQDEDGVWQLPIYSDFAAQAYTAVEYASPALVTAVEIVPVEGMEASLAGSRFEGSVDGSNWATLVAFKEAPKAGETLKASLDLYGKYTMYRFVNGGGLDYPDSKCNVAEVKISGILSGVKRGEDETNLYCINSKIVELTGGDAYSAGNTYDMPWDGNYATFYDAATNDAEISYTQAEFAEPVVIAQIVYYPRSGWTSRMVGGFFEASVDGEKWVLLHRVTVAPTDADLNYVSIKDKTAYKFFRYRNGNTELNSGGRADISEIRLYSERSGNVDATATSADIVTAGMVIDGVEVELEGIEEIDTVEEIYDTLGDATEEAVEAETVQLITSEKINLPENIEEIFGSAQWNATQPYSYDKVWDGDTNTFFASHNNAHTGIKLVAPAVVKCVEIFPRERVQNKLIDAQLQGSNDGETWTTIHKVSHYVVDGSWYTANLEDNEAAYQYYRFINDDSPNKQLDLAEVNLYTVVKDYTVEVPAEGEGTTLLNKYIARVSGDKGWNNNASGPNIPWGNYSLASNSYYDGLVGAKTIAEFDVPVLVNKISLSPRYNWGNRMVGCKVYGSNDKSEWTELCEVTTVVANGQWLDFVLENETPYQYYMCKNEKTNNNLAGILLYRVEPEKAPIDIPEKLTEEDFVEQFFSSTPINAGYGVEKAFDMDPTTFFSASPATNGEGSYVGVKLVASAIVKRVELIPRDGWQNRFVGAKLYGSNDGVNYSEILTVSSYVQDGKYLVINLPNNQISYSYYKYCNPVSYAQLADIAELQLYSTVKEDLVESVPEGVDVELNDYIVRVEGSRCWHELDRNTNRYTAQTIWNNVEDPQSTSIFFDGNGKGDGNYSVAVFEEPVTVNKIQLYPRWDSNGLNRFGGIKVSGSNDGKSWDTIMTVGSNSSEAKWYNYQLKNEVTYQYYRVTNDSNTVNLAGIRLLYAEPVVEELAGLITRDHYVEISGTADWRNKGVAGPEKAWDEDFGTYFDPDGGDIFIPGVAEDPAKVAWTQVELDGLYKISKIAILPREGWSNRLVGGVFYGSVDGTTWEKMVEVNLQPSEDIMSQILLEDPKEYRYVRYTNGGTHTFVRDYDGEVTEFTKSVRCDVAEIRLFTGEFTNEANMVKYPEDSLNEKIVHITGAMPNYPFNEVTNAFDGNIGTFYGSESNATGYLVAEFDEPTAVRSISVYPRPGQPKYMVGGKFYGSNDGKRWVALYTIADKPANRAWTRFDLKNEKEYKYYKYANANAYSDVSEIIFHSEREKELPSEEIIYVAPKSFETKTVAGFVGYVEKGTVSFERCTNNGSAKGVYAAGFVAVDTADSVIKVADSANNGSVIGCLAGWAFSRKAIKTNVSETGYLLNGGSNDNEKWLLPLPSVDGGKLPLSFLACGSGLYSDFYGYSVDENFEEVVDAADMEIFENYLQKLEDNGFTIIYTNYIDSNAYAQAQRGTTMVDMNYFENKGTMHVVFNRSGISINKFNYTYDKQDGDTTVLYMWSHTNMEQGADPTSNWITGLPEGPGNGAMNLVLKTADNKVIIWDGGIAANEQEMEYYNKFLHEITGKAMDEKVEIAAWTMTHPHGDHYAMFESLLKDYNDYVTVERVMHTLVSFQVHPASWVSQINIQQLARQNNPDVQYLRMESGQEIHLGDVTLQVLYTPDDAVHKGTGALDCGGNLNDSSVITKVTFDGKSFMILGDTNNKNYNPNFVFSAETMKCDVVQAAHHGYNQTNELYDAIRPTYAMVPDVRYNAEFLTGLNTKLGNSYYPTKHLLEMVGADRYYLSDDGIYGFYVENNDIAHVLLPLPDRTYGFGAQFENSEDSIQGYVSGQTSDCLKDVEISDYALESIDFGTVEKGERVAAKGISFRNTSYRSLVIRDISVTGDAFEVTTEDLGKTILGYDYGVGEMIHFSIVPKKGLTPGVYEEEVQVLCYSGHHAMLDQHKTITIPVKFEIKAGVEFVAQGSDTYVYNDGELVTGWFEYEGAEYYLKPADGAMIKGRYKIISGVGYTFDATGKLVEGGWTHYAKGSRYYWAGQMATGWTEIAGSTYYFDESGYMAKGTVMMDGVAYIFTEDGAYVGNDVAYTGFITTKAGTYYYVEGAQVSGWIQVDGKYYYFGSDNGGKMRTQNKIVSGAFYYINADGSSDGIGAIVAPKGTKLYRTGTQIKGEVVKYNGQTYVVDEKGWAKLQ